MENNNGRAIFSSYSMNYKETYITALNRSLNSDVCFNTAFKQIVEEYVLDRKYYFARFLVGGTSALSVDNITSKIKYNEGDKFVYIELICAFVDIGSLIKNIPAVKKVTKKNKVDKYLNKLYELNSYNKED